MRKLIAVLYVVLLSMFLHSRTASSFEDVGFLQDLNKGYEEPVDVAVSDQGEIFVLDSRLAQVLVYDKTGYYLRSFGGKGSDPGRMNRPASIALSPNREVLVADTENNRVQAFGLRGEFLFSFGGNGKDTGQFRSPTGVAVDHSGFILVADSENDRVQVFSPKGIYRFMIPFTDSPIDVAVDRKGFYYVLRPEAGLVTAIETKTTAETDITCVIGKKNYIRTAAGIAVDGQSNVYITETSEHSIKKFSKEDGLLLSFGSEGKSRGQFRHPSGIFVDLQNRIYVVDTRNKRVQILQNKAPQGTLPPLRDTFVSMIDYVETIPANTYVSDVQMNPAGDLLALSDRNNFLVIHGVVNQVVGTAGREEGQFSEPAAFDCGPDGKIYVADTRNSRVQVFDREGTFELAFGERGDKTGQLNAPEGIVVNSSGIVYVADTANDRIQMFNTDGIFLMSFGSRSKTKKGQVPPDGTFSRPTALALNSKEHLYVLDSGNHRIQVFDEKGKHLASIGKQGDRYQQFDNPVDIALDDEDYLYIADQGNHRIQVIPPKEESSTIPIVFGSVGRGYGQFDTITAVDVFDHRIYVSDQEHSGVRVYRFDKAYTRDVRAKTRVETPKANGEEKDEEVEFILR
jgi:DNA-binding beta-propeller fold protein YncE